MFLIWNLFKKQRVIKCSNYFCKIAMIQCAGCAKLKHKSGRG